MNLDFVLNDYVLIWNLLFKASISSNIQTFKQKLWKNYRHSYNELYKEEEHILKDPKNYIPFDDTIFDMVDDYILDIKTTSSNTVISLLSPDSAISELKEIGYVPNV